jgi:D-alanyl-D-alanine carboxypeptidase
MTLLENIDKAQLKKILLIVISALTLIALALLLVIIVMSIAPKTPEKSDIEYTDYAVTDKDLATGSLILADADHPFTAGSDLTQTMINCQQFRNEHRGDVENGPYYAMNNVQLTKTAMEAAHELLIAAETAVKEDNILIKYAYYGDDGKTAEFATGMLMFLTDYDENKLPENYATWLKAHAHEFGFVESYADAYRFVGVAHAKYMKENSLSLAAYVAKLKKDTSSEKVLTLTDASGAEYAVYYASCKTGETIKVPAKGQYTISGTNDGGVIITVKTAK